MKKICWVLPLLFFAMTTTAQDSWKIKLNGKLLLGSEAEDRNANIKKVKAAELNNDTGTLDVLYKEANPQAGWKRMLTFVDENDHEKLRKDSVTAQTRVKLSTLKELFTGKKKISIYTISLPTDPELAARVRVRRVHLCTLELE